MTTKTLELDKVIAALQRALDYDEIVHVESDLPEDDIVEAIRDHNKFWEGHEMDSVENGDTLEVWGWDEDTPEGQMAWRLHVDRVEEWQATE